MAFWPRRTVQLFAHRSQLQMVTMNFSSAGGVNRLCVIGGGSMGAGIAQVASQVGVNVTIVDQNETLLEKSKKSIEASMSRIAKKKHENEGAATKYVQDALSRIHLNTDPIKGSDGAQLVIEAIIESLPAKQDLFKRLDDALPPDVILASNTSSLSLTEITKHVKRKDKIGGLHFFNPVVMMKLVEVIRTETTSDATFQLLLSFGKQLGKSVVECKDTPGFIVNRLLLPYQAEAMRMFERGDASFQDIDTAMKLGAGYPMGPFELADYVGLDVTKAVMDTFHRAYPNQPLFQPISVLDKMTKEGLLGRKSGKGFYDYKK